MSVSFVLMIQSALNCDRRAERYADLHNEADSLRINARGAGTGCLNNNNNKRLRVCGCANDGQSGAEKLLAWETNQTLLERVAFNEHDNWILPVSCHFRETSSGIQHFYMFNEKGAFGYNFFVKEVTYK